MVDYPHPEDGAVEREAERFLFAQFKVGEAVREFLVSDSGRYLQGVAQQEISEAVRTFLTCNPERSADTVAAAHRKAHRARQSFHWMLEAIETGQAAGYQLQRLDDMERD